MASSKQALRLLTGAMLAGPFLLGAYAEQTVKVAWDPSGDAGTVYLLRYGTRSGIYSSERNMGSATSGTLSNLTDGVTYYIVAIASNGVGQVSEPSNEVRWTAPGENR